MPSVSDLVALGARLGMFLGILGLGVALGSALALQELQSMCISIGALPTPGTPITQDVLATMPCWQSAQRLQSVANTAGKAGGVLLLVGGVCDRFEEPIAERVRGVIG